MAETNEKKFLSLPRLQEYDALLKQEIDTNDTATLNSAKSYSDGNLNTSKTYTDTKVQNYEFITVEEIDAICGTSIAMASEVEV